MRSQLSQHCIRDSVTPSLPKPVSTLQAGGAATSLIVAMQRRSPATQTGRTAVSARGLVGPGWGASNGISRGTSHGYPRGAGRAGKRHDASNEAPPGGGPCSATGCSAFPRTSGVACTPGTEAGARSAARTSKAAPDSRQSRLPCDVRPGSRFALRDHDGASLSRAGLGGRLVIGGCLQGPGSQAVALVGGETDERAARNVPSRRFESAASRRFARPARRFARR